MVPRISAGRSRLPHGRQAWLRLAVRFALVGLLVVAGDRLAATLTHHGWTMSLTPVIAIRLLAALPTLRFPFEGFLFALEVDKWDWYWLAAGSKSLEYQALYQEWDKVLDLFVLAVALVVAMRWEDTTMRFLALSTYVLRVVGVASFMVTEQRWILVVAPNVFETLFLMFVAFQVVTRAPRMVHSARDSVLVFLAALLPKVVQEYFMHVLERRPWDWVDLPVPHTIEPQIWLFAIYVPALLVVILLARRSRRDTAATAR